MKHLISSRTALCLCGLTLCFNASAQGYVSYNHDAAKMNQITVQEIGSGGLTPAFYYDALHNSYQKTAAKKNKQFFRTMAGVSAYQQVDVADSIKASLTQRAEIEALNKAYFETWRYIQVRIGYWKKHVYRAKSKEEIISDAFERWRGAGYLGY